MKFYRETLETMDDGINLYWPWSIPLMIIWMSIAWIFILCALLEDKLENDEK